MPPDSTDAPELDPAAEWSLPPSRGRRSAVPPVVEVLRPLTPEDLPLLQSRAPAATQQISRVRHSHQQLAMLVAQGKTLTEINLITGYDPAYISRISNEDPTFRELVEHYASVDEELGIDVMRRMRTLGLTAVEVLQERIDTDPSTFSNREAMELIKLNLVEPLQRGGPIQAGGGGGGGGGPVQVNLNFVAAPAVGKLIELKPEDSK